jgi:MFS family permease
MTALGAVTLGGGLVLTALIDRLWIGYLTYGAALGVGAACAYVPTLANVGGWFDRQRATALGVAAAGTGCGTLILPPAISALIAGCGWRMTFVLLGVGAAVLLVGCALAVKPAPRTGEPVRQSLPGVAASAPFVILYGSWVLGTTALLAALVFLPNSARELGASPFAASILISLLGGMSIAGRLCVGRLVVTMGVTWLFKASVLLMAASYLLWAVSHTYAMLVLFAIVLGLGYGIRIALVPGVLIAYFGLRNPGAVLGLFFTATGIASVFGPVVAGWVIDATG